MVIPMIHHKQSPESSLEIQKALSASERCAIAASRADLADDGSDMQMLDLNLIRAQSRLQLRHAFCNKVSKVAQEVSTR
jgi:hypothetical protein